MATYSSSLLLNASHIKIIRNVIPLDSNVLNNYGHTSRVGYDVLTKVPNTSQGGVLKYGETGVYDISKRGIMKMVMTSERLAGTVTIADYNKVINDVSSSITNN